MTFDEFCKLGSLILSIVTVTIAVIGYQKFLQNKLRDKQLDVVCELIKQIQQENFHHIFFNENNKLRQGLVTLFDVTDMKEFDEFEKWYFFPTDDNTYENGLDWDFFYKFYSHPLLPKSIANALKKFTLKDTSVIPYKEIKDTKCIIIGLTNSIPEDKSCMYVRGDFGNSKAFKIAAIDLKNEIIKWAEEYKIDDLNITDSHMKNFGA